MPAGRRAAPPAAADASAARRAPSSAAPSASAIAPTLATLTSLPTETVPVVRIAIVSDIHGNRHAFEAVLDAVGASDADELWCLGDLVGYGGDPDACVQLAREHAALCLAGNHDLGVRGDLPLEQFSRGAGLAAEWTRQTISKETMDFLRALEPANTDEQVGLYHASPRDPVWEYVLSPLQAELCLDAQEHRVCLIGHSHVALSFWRSAGSPATGQTRGDGEGLDRYGRVVDQSR